jgi:hypothetical protein
MKHPNLIASDKYPETPIAFYRRSDTTTPESQVALNRAGFVAVRGLFIAAGLYRGDGPIEYRTRGTHDGARRSPVRTLENWGLFAATPDADPDAVANLKEAIRDINDPLGALSRLQVQLEGALPEDQPDVEQPIYPVHYSDNNGLWVPDPMYADLTAMHGHDKQFHIGG